MSDLIIKLLIVKITQYTSLYTEGQLVENCDRQIQITVPVKINRTFTTLTVTAVAEPDKTQ